MFKIVEKKIVYDDGKHNAFTDLILYNGTYYLAFRNGSSHSSYDGRILILKSKDGIDWNLAWDINTTTDDRDPKFFIWKDKLFLIFPTRWLGTHPHERMPMVSWLDGKKWTKPIKCYEVGWTPWRPRVIGGNLLASFYFYHPSKLEFWESALMRSYDGIHWEKVSTIYFGDGANETDIFSFKEGIIAIIRREGYGIGRWSTIVAEGKIPFNEWKYHDLGIAIHAPCIFKIRDELFICGRHFMMEKRMEEIKIWRLAGKGKIESILSLGYGEDVGYCGAYVRGNEVLISYYIGNPLKASIYIALLEIIS